MQSHMSGLQMTNQPGFPAGSDRWPPRADDHTISKGDASGSRFSLSLFQEVSSSPGMLGASLLTFSNICEQFLLLIHCETSASSISGFLPSRGKDARCSQQASPVIWSPSAPVLLQNLGEAREPRSTPHPLSWRYFGGLSETASSGEANPAHVLSVNIAISLAISRFKRLCYCAFGVPETP